MNDRVAIITVNWNHYPETAECLLSLRKLDSSRHVVIVIDNGSSDDSVLQIRHHFPEVYLIENQQNRGLAAANNQGIQRAKEMGVKHILLLNNDTVVDPGLITCLVAAARRHPSVGIFAPKIYYHKEPNRIWMGAHTFDEKSAEFHNHGHNVMDDGHVLVDERTVAYANGCAIFIRMDVVESIGLMDERLFVYYEEIDFCFRARAAGFGIRYIPAARLWHKVARTNGGARSLIMQYFEMRNQWLWAKKNLSEEVYSRFCRRWKKRLLPSLLIAKNVSWLKRFYWDIRLYLRAEGWVRLTAVVDALTGRFNNCPQWVRDCAQKKSSSQKRILLMVDSFCFPIDSGNKIRTWSFMQEFARCGYELDVINLYCPKNGQPFLCDHRLFRHVYNIPKSSVCIFQPPSFVKRIFSFLMGVPWELARMDSAACLRIHDILAGTDCDVIFTRYMTMAAYVIRCGRTYEQRMVVDLDDVETRKSLRQLDYDGYHDRYDKFRKRLNVWVYEQYHKRHLKRMAGSLVCSLEDRRFMTRQGWTEKVDVIPNTVMPAMERLPLPLVRKTILFVGKLDYCPNVDGMIWFIREVFPLIRKKDPQIRLQIVGSIRDKKKFPIKSDGVIDIAFNVEDIKPYYRDAAVVVVPIFVAGGTRIKIVEAAFLGRPVVSTSVGCEGLGLQSGRHTIIKNKATGFADAVLRCCADESFSRSLAEEAYHFVQRHYSQDVIKEQIKQVFEQYLKGEEDGVKKRATRKVLLPAVRMAGDSGS